MNYRQNEFKLNLATNCLIQRILWGTIFQFRHFNQIHTCCAAVLDEMQNYSKKKLDNSKTILNIKN